MEKHGSSCFVWSQLAPPPSSLFAFSPQLLETKSTDRKQTLLHYISNVVKEKYQHVSLFYNELHYVEKAAAGTVTLLCLVSGGGMRAVRGTSRHTVRARAVGALLGGELFRLWVQALAQQERCSIFVLFPSVSWKCPLGREGAAEGPGSDKARVHHAWPQHDAEGVHSEQRREAKETAGWCQNSPGISLFSGFGERV